ncbi:DUF1376 domain-containing protein [Bradyrhizobium sp. BRP22]|uniref:DUF1376 domain-containing protein n=1 Tax=Bradyrhizobium sp. BRP22 TaxID=2793821 RepID=UPI001CD76E5D|nr:DUF1376 domain-containing protein [Bradyrhizobium sp. BRP22]MCA1458069.1 DUF1376 domain-containing protein [Bradyrhizobium sp. BRP22]
MPLDVVRLRDSDLSVTATGDEFRAAILLWCAAWHQVPASSLPDDDRMLARFAGYGRDLKGWKAVREAALHGFVRCSDGRLYHPVIGDMALKADQKRKGNSRRTAAATAAAAAARRALRERAESRDDVRNGSNAEDVTGPKRREEKRSEENTAPSGAVAAPPLKSIFKPGDFELTERIMRAQGLDPSDPKVVGTTYFANKWREAGWQPDLIIATIERLMAKRDKPPGSLKYFEGAIADAHADLARGVPQGSATGPPRPPRAKTAAEVFLELDDKLNGRNDANEPHQPVEPPSQDLSAGPGIILDA